MKYAQYLNHLFDKARLQGTPLSGNFELTARCNLDCKMCYIHKRQNDNIVMAKEHSAQEWIDLATEAKNNGMFMLLLTGGEPLLRKDFPEIYMACKQLGLMVSVNTNGTLLTEDIADMFAYAPPSRINITLYGASRETYKNLCGQADAYDRTIHSIELLQARNVQVKINFSATPYNVEDLPKIYQYCKQKDLFIQTCSYMFPPVRACEECVQAEHRLDARTAGLVRFYDDSEHLSREELLQRREGVLRGDYIPYAEDECMNRPIESIRCRAGETTFWVTYDWQMRPCGMMLMPTYPVNEKEFSTFWRIMRDERQKIMEPYRCTVCKWRNVCTFCSAGCYAENGSYTITPKYLCDMTDAYVQAYRDLQIER